MPAFSLRLDDIESMNVLKNYKYTPVIWKWLDRFPVFNLDYVMLNKETKHLLVSVGGVFICMVGIWMGPFGPAAHCFQTSHLLCISIKLYFNWAELVGRSVGGINGGCFSDCWQSHHRVSWNNKENNSSGGDLSNCYISGHWGGSGQ